MPTDSQTCGTCMTCLSSGPCLRVQAAQDHARTLAVATGQSAAVVKLNGVFTAVPLAQIAKHFETAICVIDPTGRRWAPR